MPAQYALHPYFGHSRSPHVPGSWDSPRGLGERFGAGLLARALARRSAAACLRRSRRRSAAACRLRLRSPCRFLVAALRLRVLKSDFGAQVWTRPRGLRQLPHSHVTGRCSVERRRRLRLPGLHRCAPNPRGFPQAPHRTTPRHFNPMGLASSAIGTHRVATSAPQVRALRPGRHRLRGGDQGSVSAGSAWRATSPRVVTSHRRSAASRSAFLTPRRFTPSRPGGILTSTLGTPRLAHDARTLSPVASAYLDGE
jgi:hypothetical protein